MNAQQQNQSESLEKVQTFQKNLISAPKDVKNTLGITKGGAEFNFYGNVRLDGTYQIEGGSLARMYNQISTVPLSRESSASDVLKSTLAATRLGLDFKTPTSTGSVGGKLEVDFLGANDSLRIRHAYLTYNNWLIGQTWSNFAIPDYMPESIDALGYVGGSVKRDPQVRYTKKINSQSSVVVALEDPKDTSSKMRLPALTMRLNQQFTSDFSISLRGMVDEKRTNNDHETAWGIGLGAKYDLLENTVLKADYYHVKGDSSFVSWTNAGFLVNTDQDIVATNQFNSITVGITQQFNSKIRSTVGYGYMKAEKNNRYIDYSKNLTQVNKDLWQAWANVFYTPVKPISFGLEYVYGKREAYGADAQGSHTGIDNRFNVIAIYNF